MFVPAAADAVGLVQKEVPVTQGGFGILVDRHDDRLDVMVAPTFARCPLTNLSKRLFNLPKHSGDRPTLPFENAQPVPQAYDFSLFCSVHNGPFAGCCTS